MLSERHERLLRQTFLDYQQTSEFLQAPLIIERAEGLYYWDTQQRRYFDAIGGIFVAVLGHRHPRTAQLLVRLPVAHAGPPADSALRRFQ